MGPSRTLAIMSVAAALLAACDQPAPPRHRPSPAAAAAPAPPPAEHAQAIRWNEIEQTFELHGEPLKAAKLWTFDGSTDGFVLSGGEAGLAPGSGLKVVEQAADPILRSPSGLNVDGAMHSLVLVRLTRAAAGEAWSGAMHYTTADHGESAAFMAAPVLGTNPAVNETTILVYDMTQLAQGGADWTQSIIDQLRFDFEDQPGGEFLVRQVAITNNPTPGALAD